MNKKLARGYWTGWAILTAVITWQAIHQSAAEAVTWFFRMCIMGAIGFVLFVVATWLWLAILRWISPRPTDGIISAKVIEQQKQSLRKHKRNYFRDGQR